MILEFYIDIEDGNIVQKRMVRKKFDQLKDGSYKISIQSGKRRTNKENRYYWGTVLQLVFDGLRDMGFEKIIDKEDAHLVCKSLFLKQDETRNGVRIEKAGSSKKLTTVEFEEYIQHITIWAGDYLNVVIPPPGHQMSIDY